MSDPTNKVELLEAMQSGYAAFEAFLAPLSETRLTTPGVNDEWSIKDHLVHLAAWQNRIANRVEALLRGDEANPNRPLINNDEEMNRFNDATFAANRSRALNQVRADFRSSYQRLLEGTRQLSDSDLFDPQRYKALEGSPIWEGIAGNSFGHYEEHTQMIKAWLERQQAQ